MALIKHADSTRASRDAIVLNLGDLRHEAERMRTSALAERDRILAEARSERDRILAGASEAGYDAGFTEGFAKGTEKGEQDGTEQAYREARERTERFESALCEAIDRFAEEREIVAREARSDLVLFACAFAERVTKRIIDLDATVVDAQIEAAVKLVLNATRLVITIHPDDREVCARVTPMLERRRVAELPVEFLEDESLERGSVVLRTDKGLIDASVGMQIERIICALVGTERFEDRMAAPEEPEADDASGEPA